MRALVRAEFIKLGSTRTMPGLVVGATAVAALGAASTIMSARPEDLARAVHDQPFFMLASVNLAIFAMVLGIRAFTDEFRHGTIVSTLVVAPDRRSVVAAKMATSAAAGVGLAAVAQVVMVAIGLMLIETKGAEATFEGTDLAAMGGAVPGRGAVGSDRGWRWRHRASPGGGRRRSVGLDPPPGEPGRGSPWGRRSLPSWTGGPRFGAGVPGGDDLGPGRGRHPPPGLRHAVCRGSDAADGPNRRRPSLSLP